MTLPDEMEWLAEHGPQPIVLHETATRRARTALLEDMTSVRARPRRRAARLAAVGLAAGGVAVAVGLTTGGPTVTERHHVSLGGGVPAAAAAPLATLSTKLHARASQSTLTGDATLITRHQRYPDRGPVDAVDLFGDDGSYYTADSVAGLPTAIAAERTDTNPADDWAFIQRDVAAAEAAFDGTIDAARQRMGDAAYIPGHKPDPHASDAAIAEKERAAAKAGKHLKVTPISEQAQLENRIWSNSMDALNAGAARPAVRAGVLHLLATIDAVTVTKATEGDRDVLILSTPVAGSVERLTIDAGTGMPIRYTDTEPGQQPSVSVTYDVSRVTLADVAKG